MKNENYLLELSTGDRIKALEDTADKVEETTYLKELSSEDLDIKREELAENSIKLDDLTKEAKSVADGFKEKMKPVKEDITRLIVEIKTKSEMREGKVYHVADHDRGMMDTYDATGELIGSRRLRPEEKQANLFVTR